MTAVGTEVLGPGVSLVCELGGKGGPEIMVRCPRDFTAFFRDGALSDTVYTVWPDGHSVSAWMTHTPWHHPIPGGPA